MKMICLRCDINFSDIVKKYPTEKDQTKIYNKEGDVYVDCPKCQRRYFKNNEGQFYSDRPLLIFWETE